MDLLWIALFAVLCIGIAGLVAACDALAPTDPPQPGAEPAHGLQAAASKGQRA